MNNPYQGSPYTDRLLHGCKRGWRRGTTMVNHSWHVDAGHWLEGWTVTQKVRPLSSGESEFYWQGSGAARGLLVKHICHEVGEPKKKLMLHCDSVASRGMAQRLGAGKFRHIEVKWLWLQQGHDREEVSNKACSNRVEHC